MHTPQTADSVEVPAYRRPAERRTNTKTFRLFRDQVELLDENYPESSSALIRFLLDKYFNGEMREVVKEFHTFKTTTTK
jgi:hypothetical protein